MQTNYRIPAPYRLDIGAPARLAAIRGGMKRDYTLNTWRNAYGAGLHHGGGQWYTHGGEQFRDERDAHDILPRLPRGWYTDADANETAVGIVARLPHGRFIAGYRWTSNGERVYFPEVFTDEDDAAGAADGHAERFAEDAREDDERFRAMADAEGHAEAVADDVAMAYQARNVSARHREHCRDRIEELKAARDEVKDATDAYNKG